MLTLEMIREAREALKGVARVTPLNPTKNLGKNVFIKCENLQLTGAFKLRGAYNKLRTLSPEERERGVIACSAGNHAQGIALSATKLGMKSVICMPAGAPISKIEATKNYGAEVVLVPGVYDDAAAEAKRLCEEKGYTFAHPFNDPYVMAGQGTIGLEILEQLPDVEQIIVPIGGGGLIAGVACAVKHLKPDCRIIGVQAQGAASMWVSRNNGKITELSSVSTIADGIAVKVPGDLTFELCEKYVDEIVTVKESEIAAAIMTLMEDQKIVSEGAGATTVAAVLFGKVSAADKKTVCLVSGGNVDVTTLSRIITKGLTKSGRITNITTKVVDKPGELNRLLTLVAQNGANVLSVNHDREDYQSEVNACVVNLAMETRDRRHAEDILNNLQENGYPVNWIK
ncbi:MAG: threonine ammonia-lyase [Oscillospiraceae bacterium]|nr:threonine ammonia-lyase [Oscillospiraceae bacterium]